MEKFGVSESVSELTQTSVGNYVLIEETAKTNSSRIFKARVAEGNADLDADMTPELPSDVAVKVAILPLVSDKTILKEFEVLEMLDHPGVIKPLEIGTDLSLDGQTYPYMVTQFSEMGDLFKYVMSQKRLLEDQAREYFRQILEAVKFLHSQGIAHRDLKLQNILMENKDNVQLIDFGFAEKFDPDDCTKNSGIKEI